MLGQTKRKITTRNYVPIVADPGRLSRTMNDRFRRPCMVILSQDLSAHRRILFHPNPFFFIFMQFSTKIMPNNRLVHPCLGSSGSATGDNIYFCMKCMSNKNCGFNRIFVVWYTIGCKRWEVLPHSKSMTLNFSKIKYCLWWILSAASTSVIFAPSPLRAQKKNEWKKTSESIRVLLTRLIVSLALGTVLSSVKILDSKLKTKQNKDDFV